MSTKQKFQKHKLVLLQMEIEQLLEEFNFLNQEEAIFGIQSCIEDLIKLKTHLGVSIATLEKDSL